MGEAWTGEAATRKGVTGEAATGQAPAGQARGKQPRANERGRPLRTSSAFGPRAGIRRRWWVGQTGLKRL
jgi:hypothetical protein